MSKTYALAASLSPLVVFPLGTFTKEKAEQWRDKALSLGKTCHVINLAAE